MALLDQEIRGQISEVFADLDEQIRLILFTRRKSPLVLPGRSAEEDCPSCEDAEALFGEVAELSDKIELEIHDVREEPEVASQYGIDRVPALVLRGPHDAGLVRFFGLPAGYEFSTLIADVVDVSKSTIQLSQRTRDELENLEEDVHIQVFVTPT
jgi:alkyl hydroperoxide reductase subunit AhpF